MFSIVLVDELSDAWFLMSISATLGKSSYRSERAVEAMDGHRHAIERFRDFSNSGCNPP